MDPKSLKSLICDVQYSNGNYLIHQLVLNNSKQSDTCSSESDIRAAFRSFSIDRVNARDKGGYTALHLAVMKRNSFMVKMLLSCLPTIDVNAKWSYFSRAPLHFAVDTYFSDVYIHPKNNYDKTELDEYVKRESLEIVNFLLASGADIDIKDNCGQTPLHVAVEENQIDLMNVFISNGANLNIKDYRGCTPLHLAIKESGFEAVKLLVEGGADKNEQSNSGHTPLHLAVGADLKDVMEYLISKNVDLNTKAVWGKTPLHTAVINNNLGEVKILVESGALLNLKDELYGQTPLHIAAQNNNVDITEFLIGSGADVNAENSMCRTPLHEAVNKSRFPWEILKVDGSSCLRTVEVLVKNGADVEAVDRLGETPLRIAERQNCIEIVQFLKSRVTGEETSLPKAASSNSSGLEPLSKKRRIRKT